MRLVVLGGSAASTPELFDALAHWPGCQDRRPELDVILVGRDATKLELVARGCRARPVSVGAPVHVVTQTDRRRALEAADVVVNQVRIGGLDARAFDESFPWEFGLPGEETVGPGGFANALRTVPALRPTWRDIADVAPASLVVNLTNPAGIVQQAATAGWPLRVVSACDSPVTFVAAVAARLGRPVADTQRRYIGLNHLGWYLPDSAEELERLADLATGIDPEQVGVLGALPAAYIRYFVNPDRLLAAQQGKETRAQALRRLESDLLDGYAVRPNGDLPRRGAVWYEVAVLPLIDAWLHGSDVPFFAGTRNDGHVAGLPDSVTVELPHVAPHARELLALEPLRASGYAAALLQHHAAYEALTVEALQPDAPPDARLRALLANPLIHSYDQALGLLRRIEEQAQGAR